MSPWLQAAILSRREQHGGCELAEGRRTPMIWSSHRQAPQVVLQEHARGGGDVSLPPHHDRVLRHHVGHPAEMLELELIRLCGARA